MCIRVVVEMNPRMDRKCAHLPSLPPCVPEKIKAQCCVEWPTASHECWFNTVTITSTWTAAVVGHTPRTLILHRELGVCAVAEKATRPCSDRLKGHAGEDSCFYSSLAKLIHDHILIFMDAEWTEQYTDERKTPNPLRRRAQPLATTRIHISNHRETTALRTQPASRVPSPLSCSGCVFSRWR